MEIVEFINSVFTSPFEFITDDQWESVLRVIILIFLGLPLLGLFRRWTRNFLLKIIISIMECWPGKLFFIPVWH